MRSNESPAARSSPSASSAPSARRSGRRKAIEALVGLGGLAALAGLGLAGRRRRVSPVTENRLRPPGAVAERDFAAQCIRCGRCAAVCPYKSIRLLDTADARLDAGTPIVEIEDVPCYLCMKCVDVCPSGAIRPIELAATRMGLAKVNREECVAWTGEILCRTCYNVCPLKDRAIDLPLLRPEVIPDHCTGCGICVHGCPVTGPDGKKAINVLPPKAGAASGAAAGGSAATGGDA